VRFFEDCVENRGEVARRGIDYLQDLCGRNITFQRVVTLPGALVEPLLQLGVSPPKFDYFVVERRGHLPAPSLPAPDRMILLWPAAAVKSVRLDHLLVESVKSASGLLGV
jgi:hypothetical protein